LGSPYFTAHPITIPTSIDMPLQMKSKSNRFKTDMSDTLQSLVTDLPSDHVQTTFNKSISIVQQQDTSDNEKGLYDSLFLELSKNNS
jgi:hypothetical protein